MNVNYFFLISGYISGNYSVRASGRGAGMGGYDLSRTGEIMAET
ncbi:MAG: hypothetical protein RIN56_17735 [Sporomusaceae bacterium]|nr:hypothetical protein [Sporomusaceae bacterium]